MNREGLKTLAQIAVDKDAVNRVRDLATLLEYTVVQLSPKTACKLLTFEELLKEYRQEFSDFRSVDFARQIRNRLSHTRGQKATRGQVLQAEFDLEQAIRDLRRICPQRLWLEIEGDAEHTSTSTTRTVGTVLSSVRSTEADGPTKLQSVDEDYQRALDNMWDDIKADSPLHYESSQSLVAAVRAMTGPYLSAANTQPEIDSSTLEQQGKALTSKHSLSEHSDQNQSLIRKVES